MNEQALAVMDRIAKKLTGRDFNKEEVLDVPAQVWREEGRKKKKRKKKKRKL